MSAAGSTVATDYRALADENSRSPQPAPRWTAGPALLIGPLPPPYHGVAVATENAVAIGPRFGIPTAVLDIADRRGVGNIGLIDFNNVYLALRHGIQFLWLLLTRRPSVVYLTLAQGTLGFLRDAVFMVPARLARRKLVVHLNGGLFDKFYRDSSAPMRALIRYSLGGATLGIVLGEKLVGIFDGLIPRSRIRILPNGIDPAPFDVMRARLPARLAGRRLQVAYLAAVTDSKGPFDLLRAVPEIRKQVPDVQVVVYGEVVTPEDKAILAEIMAGEAGNDSIEMRGIVKGDDKLRALLDADVFVFPSRYPPEGHPFVILEAMAAGLPIVTTDQACISETVIDGENGFIVPQGDVDAIGRATIRLLKDAELRQRMGDANRRRLREVYLLDDWQRRLAGILAEAAAER